MFIKHLLTLIFFSSLLFAQSDPNQMVFMDGHDDFVKFSRPIITSNNFTIECWANMIGLGGGDWRQNTLFEQRSNRDAEKFSSIVFWAENQDAEISAGLMSGGGYWKSFKHPRVEYNEWHHYCMVLNENKVYVYLDGNFITGGDLNQGNDFLEDIDFIDIGRHRYDSNDWGFFNGMIDEFRIWNRALSAEAITTVMEDTLGPEYYSNPDSGLVAYWRFDDAYPLYGSQEELLFFIRDLTRNNHHGILLHDATLIPRDMVPGDNVIRMENRMIDSTTVFLPLHIDFKSVSPFTHLSFVLTGFKDRATLEQIIPNSEMMNIEKTFIDSQLAGDTLFVDISSPDPMQTNGNLLWLKWRILDKVNIPLKVISAEIGGVSEPPLLIQGGLYKAVNLGDANRDNLIDESDAEYILDIVLDRQEIPPDEFVYADVSGNGQVTALDASIVLQYFNQRIDRLPITDTGAVYSFSGQIVLGQPIWHSATEVEIPILLEKVYNIYALSGEMSYNDSSLQFIEFKPNLTMNYNEFISAEPGKIHYAVANTDPLQGTDILGFLRFNAETNTNSLITELNVVINEGHLSTPVRHKGDTDTQPLAFRLGQNYPNPFNPVTTIPFSIQKAGHVNLSVYNVYGQLVKTCTNKPYYPGHHQVEWNGTDMNNNPVSSGVYLYVFSLDNNVLNKKRMLFLK
jgi:hypothetical protein